MLAEPFAPSCTSSADRHSQRGSSRPSLKRSRSSASLLTPPDTTDIRMDTPDESGGSTDFGHVKPSLVPGPWVDIDPFDATPTRQVPSQGTSRTTKTLCDSPDDAFQDSTHNPFLEGGSGVSKNDKTRVGELGDTEVARSVGRKMIYVL
jgi:hypothetical protein